MADRKPLDRRGFVLAGVGIAGLVTGAAGFDAVAQAIPASAATAIPATEDLMTDHGMLKRILLIYRDYIRRLDTGDSADPAGLFHAAQLVHDYIEGFHEGIEEGFVFPRLLRANSQTDTVRTLLTQHDRGRKLTIRIITATTTMTMGSMPASPGFATAAGRADLRGCLDRFVAMYEPHEAREDTEVFPAFRALVDHDEFGRISERIAGIQHDRYGDDPLAGFLGEIADIERSLGIHDLAAFTPEQ